MKSKIDQIFNAFWNRIVYAILVAFGGKMETSWHQHRSQIDVQFEKRCFEKNRVVLLGKTILLNVLEVKVGTKNESKINQKMSSTSEGLLASIFGACWWVLGAKLGGQMEPKAIQKGIEKIVKKWNAPRWPKIRN